MIEERIAGRQVVVCVGAGGVGKTTVSAALALGLAARGRRVAVVTIDPARRLADALGLEELGNEPRLVDPARFTGHGVELRGADRAKHGDRTDGEGPWRGEAGPSEFSGELWAMMLDPKHTFDDLIEQLAPDERSRDEILANRIYQQLSSAVAGSQEFTAIAKLYELHVSGRFDVLVLDTPPSRNALDFLDAPDRLLGFLEGNALRALLAPTGLAARVVGRGTGLVFGVLQKVTGVDLLADLSVFFRALGGLLDGFRQRAGAVKALLADPATTFLIVASPRREPVDEAIFFAGRLADAGMGCGGVIVNRVTPPAGLDDEPAAVEAALRARLGVELARKVAATYADARALAHREAALIERLRREAGDPDPLLLAQLGGDVHDVDGLVRVSAALFG